MAGVDATTRLLTHTHKEYDKIVSAQVFEGARALNLLKRHGAVRLGKWGTNFRFVIQHKESTHGQWYVAGTLAEREGEVLTKALYADPKFYRITETLPDTELDLNQGANAIQDIYREYADIVVTQMSEDLNSKITPDNSADGNVIDGLETLITSTTGTYLGLDRSDADNAFWRCNQQDVSNDFSANGWSKMMDMWLSLQHDGDGRPDIILTTQKTWKNYAEVVREDLWIKPKESDIGYDTLGFNGVPLFWDRDCTANRMYFLNTRGGRGAPFQVLAWIARGGSGFTAPVQKEEYIEGFTFGWKCILQQLARKPRLLGKIVNCDMI